MPEADPAALAQAILALRRDPDLASHLRGEAYVDVRTRFDARRQSALLEQRLLDIAKRYLVPRQLDFNGLTPKDARFNDQALKWIIEYPAGCAWRHAWGLALAPVRMVFSAAGKCRRILSTSIAE